MNRKILFIGMTDSRGGLETFMMNIFRKLNRKNYNFEFIKDFSNKKMAYEDEIKKSKGVIRSVPILDEKNLKPIIKYFKRKKMVKDFFKKHHDYTIIHINTLNINGIIFWVKEARKYGIKVIVHLHLDKIDNPLTSCNSLYKIKSFLSKILTYINLKYINKNNKIVKLAASNNAGRYFFSNGDFKVIDNGINVQKYKYNYTKRQSVRDELHISDDFKIIMTVARINHQKNYPKIIRVFNNVKKMDSNVKLVIVGGGDLVHKITSLVSNYGLKKDVYFLGERDDVNILLSAADLILMPSTLEAFPFSLIESQAAGVPALVSAGVIPAEENITGNLKYLPLSYNDCFWAKQALNLLYKKNDLKIKNNMYEDVYGSKYNIDNSIKEIKDIYDS